LPCQLEAAAGSSQFFHPVYEVLQSLESRLNLVEGAGQLHEDAAGQNPIDKIVPAEKVPPLKIQSMMEAEESTGLHPPAATAIPMPQARPSSSSRRRAYEVVTSGSRF
jgi:hypothetical protein